MEQPVTVDINLSTSSRLQINTNFNSSRLTPQGEYFPNYVMNMGFRQELFEGNVSLILTVADVLKTLKREYVLNTPLLNQAVINSRDSRIVYIGLTYRFGNGSEQPKEEQLRYDDNR